MLLLDASHAARKSSVWAMPAALAPPKWKASSAINFKKRGGARVSFLSIVGVAVARAPTCNRRASVREPGGDVEVKANGQVWDTTKAALDAMVLLGEGGDTHVGRMHDSTRQGSHSKSSSFGRWFCLGFGRISVLRIFLKFDSAFGF